MDFAIVGHHIVNLNAIALDMSTFFYEIEKLYNPQPVTPTVSLGLSLYRYGQYLGDSARNQS